MTGSFVVSTLIGVTLVLSAALTATALSRTRRAATRHALLTGALAVVLGLPVASAVAAYSTVRVAVPAPAAIARAVTSFDDAPMFPAADLAATPASGAPAAPATSRVSLAAALEGLWITGLVACLAPIVIGLVQVGSLGRRGLPWPQGGAIADALARSRGLRRPVSLVLHESVSGPMTFGTRRPTIVMPLDAETWADDDLRRAVVHELEHVRRSDWFTQLAARSLCAVYWFHPLMWIARRQLVLEAERASDDAVLEYAEAHAYADQLVDLARRLSAGHRPLLAMANRHDLATRVHALLDVRLPRGRAGAWLVAAVSAVAALLVVLISPMRVVAKSPQTPAAGAHPRFDVISVRPCDRNAPRAAGGRGGTPGQVSPGHLLMTCRPVATLIETAYVTFADGHATPPTARLSFDMHNAKPDWIRSDLYTIEATTGDAPPLPVLEGPMLQSLLEERFQLKTHRESRVVPIYELIEAKGGAKLTPFKPGSCVPFDANVYPPAPLEPGQHRCSSNTTGQTSDGKWIDQVEGVTLDDFFADISDPHNDPSGAPVPIVNKTGITGPQTFQFLYSGRSYEDYSDSLRPLGLQLRQTKGPRDFLVIDHVERPTPDGPLPAPTRMGAK